MAYLLKPIPDESTMGHPNSTWTFDDIDELYKLIKDPEEWEIYRIDKMTRIKIHAMFLQEDYDTPIEQNAEQTNRNTQNYQTEENNNGTTI